MGTGGARLAVDDRTRPAVEIHPPRTALLQSSAQKTAYATIKGFEVMRALRKGQAGLFAIQDGIVGEAKLVERAFGLRPCALTKVMVLLQDRLANAET